jgi:predicted naringenin-chalcone synthase
MNRNGIVLQSFLSVRPQLELDQRTSLHWLGRTHSQAERVKNPESLMDPDLLIHLFERYGCSPSYISKRGVELPDLLEGELNQMKILSPKSTPSDCHEPTRGPSGAGISVRTGFFAQVATERIRELFKRDRKAPQHLIHVTCTGYVSPSPVQVLINERQWNLETQVTHAYHMGCYASHPAVRIAQGFCAAGLDQVDVVHTEVCSLHLDLVDHSPEQMVVQSLFGDGYMRYSAVNRAIAQPGGLDLITIHEEILPNSQESMTWRPSEWGMKMTLSRDVPQRIATAIRQFVTRMINQVPGGITNALGDAVFAIHPGGPKIIEQLQRELSLRDEQVAHSKAILYQYGNMSSATLPHVWAALSADTQVRAGTWVISLAFGPGLTAFGSVLRKRSE